MIEQGTDAWRQQRCGLATASRFADVMATVKSGGEAADRRNYRAQLLCERLTGKPAETFTNRAMLVGTEREPDARALYQVRTRRLVDEAGFVLIEGLRAGASPDGLIGDDGLIEIKCPNPATHIDYLRLPDGECPRAYFWQVQGQMLATGRQWCDFVSFDPRLPVDMQMFIRRVHRDADLIADLEAEVEAFLRELDDKVTRLRDLYSTAEAA
mgnify:CR=1 FL=1